MRDLEKKLKKASEERDKLSTVVRENNAELKAMECSLTGNLLLTNTEMWWTSKTFKTPATLKAEVDT